MITCGLFFFQRGDTGIIAEVCFQQGKVVLVLIRKFAGVFFGLMFGLGGLGSAFFGWLADKTSIEFIFRISTLLPLLGIITGFLPNIEGKTTNT